MSRPSEKTYKPCLHQVKDAKGAFSKAYPQGQDQITSRREEQASSLLAL